MDAQVKISLIISRLKEKGKKVNTNNIITESLFLAGGTVTEKDINEYFKKHETKIEMLQRKNRLINFFLLRFSDEEKLKMIKNIKRSNLRITVKISKIHYLYHSIVKESIKIKANKLIY